MTFRSILWDPCRGCCESARATSALKASKESFPEEPSSFHTPQKRNFSSLLLYSTGETFVLRAPISAWVKSLPFPLMSSLMMAAWAYQHTYQEGKELGRHDTKPNKKVEPRFAYAKVVASLPAKKTSFGSQQKSKPALSGKNSSRIFSPSKNTEEFLAWRKGGAYFAQGYWLCTSFLPSRLASRLFCLSLCQVSPRQERLEQHRNQGFQPFSQMRK